MTLTELEEDGYRVVRAASVKGPRGASGAMVLRKPKNNYLYRKFITWTFDGKQYCPPVSIRP